LRTTLDTSLDVDSAGKECDTYNRRVLITAKPAFSVEEEYFRLQQILPYINLSLPSFIPSSVRQPAYPFRMSGSPGDSRFASQTSTMLSLLARLYPGTSNDDFMNVDPLIRDTLTIILGVGFSKVAMDMTPRNVISNVMVVQQGRIPACKVHSRTDTGTFQSCPGDTADSTYTVEASVLKEPRTIESSAFPVDVYSELKCEHSFKYTITYNYSHIFVTMPQTSSLAWRLSMPSDNMCTHPAVPGQLACTYLALMEQVLQTMVFAPTNVSQLKNADLCTILLDGVQCVNGITPKLVFSGISTGATMAMLLPFFLEWLLRSMDRSMSSRLSVVNRDIRIVAITPVMVFDKTLHQHLANAVGSVTYSIRKQGDMLEAIASLITDQTSISSAEVVTNAGRCRDSNGHCDKTICNGRDPETWINCFMYALSMSELNLLDAHIAVWGDIYRKPLTIGQTADSAGIAFAFVDSLLQRTSMNDKCRLGPLQLEDELLLHMCPAHDKTRDAFQAYRDVRLAQRFDWCDRMERIVTDHHMWDEVRSSMCCMEDAFNHQFLPDASRRRRMLRR